ncbi:MFS transporter [Natrarchaeobius sp. A-rgal3]|uniref:MFS transporter n=1 Tax=Natrarchaeobius versutus TaxID=1679078 RepID=UPI0035101616
MDLMNTIGEYRSLFSNRMYRILFSGRIVTLIGDNLYIVAAMWLVYELTGSTFFTGLAAFLGRVPTTLSFLVGPIVDSRNPRLILTVTQLVQMAVVLLVPIVVVVGQLDIAVVLVVMFLVSLTDQFSGPAMDAALPRIVGSEQLVKANSMFTFTRRGMEAGSKAAAGILIGVLGAVAIFLVNAFTFLLGALIFTLLRVPDPNRRETTSDGGAETLRTKLRNYLDNLYEGTAIIGHSAVLYIVLGTGIANFLNGLSIAVLPAYADSISGTADVAGLIGGASTYGILYAGVGLGLFLGAALASEFERYSFGLATVGLFVWTAAAWIGAVALGSVFPTAVLFTIAWIPIGIYNILSISLLQQGVPDRLLGRVMATSASVSSLLTSVGILLGGAAGELVLTSTVMMLAGAGFFVVGLYWAAAPTARGIPSIDETDAGVFDLDSRDTP